MNLEQIYELKLCPVCGFQLDFKPWNNVGASDEICPCCGIQFGYHDATPGRREPIYDEWRQRWIDDGRQWSSTNHAPPEFDADKQLKQIGLLDSN